MALGLTAHPLEGHRLLGLPRLAALEEDLPGRALELGRHLMEGLKVLKEEHPHLIEDVRGRGLMVGVEFADADIGALVVAEMAERGVLTAFGLNNPKVVRLEPPLIIGKEHVDEALAVFAEALKATEEALEGLLG